MLLAIVGLLFLSSAHGQTASCATDDRNGSERCLAAVTRVPFNSEPPCKPDAPGAGSRSESDKRDEQVAKARLAEARMSDAERPIPDDHTNLEESFDAARTHETEDEALENKLRITPPTVTCPAIDAPLIPLSDLDSVEISFDAPIQCLQTLQDALGGKLAITIESASAAQPTPAAAKLVEVATTIDGTENRVRTRAKIENPGMDLFDDDTVIVRLQCR